MISLPVHAEVQVEDLVRDFPAAVGFLRRRGIVCIQCGEPVWGTVGELVTARGQDVGEVLAALNAHLGSEV